MHGRIEDAGEGYTGKVKQGIGGGSSRLLLTAALAATLAAPMGCQPFRQIGDGITGIVTSDESVEVKAKRSLAALYASQAFADDTLTALNESRLISLKQAEDAGEKLDKSLIELKRIDLAIRSGLLANVRADLDSVEQMIGAVLQALPEVDR